MAVAAKHPGTNAGKMARYYSALCMEDLEKHNQALEELKKISSGNDKELAALAQYQIAVINARTGQQDEAIKQLRALADKSALFVPRPLVLLELAGVLKQTRPQEAAAIYQQIKKEFPNTAASEEADRGLGMLTGKA
jgi:predicted negative regulator of RcsB-dependent stress response